MMDTKALQAASDISDRIRESGVSLFMHSSTYDDIRDELVDLREQIDGWIADIDADQKVSA